MILHFGRQIPSDGERVERNEGVVIVFDPCSINFGKSVEG